MDEQIQNTQSQNNSTWEKVKLFSNWFFGIIFAFFTLTLAIDESYGAIPFLFCTLLTLPPLSKQLKKIHVSLPAWLKIILIIALIYLAGYIFSIEG
jgi:hypothetical protein